MQFLKIIGIFFSILLLSWITISCWVECEGKAFKLIMNGDPGFPEATIIFDPDPIYDLDKQLCLEFGKTLEAKGWKVNILTVAQTRLEPEIQGNYWLICSNTYNWWPDWSITRFIRTRMKVGQSVIALTLGSGSTANSKRILEEKLLNAGAHITDSKSLWLLRPNDEQRLKENNVAVAKSMVNQWAGKLADSLTSVRLQ